MHIDTLIRTFVLIPCSMQNTFIRLIRTVYNRLHKKVLHSCLDKGLVLIALAHHILQAVI